MRAGCRLKMAQSKQAAHLVLLRVQVLSCEQPPEGVHARVICILLLVRLWAAGTSGLDCLCCSECWSSMAACSCAGVQQQVPRKCRGSKQRGRLTGPAAARPPARPGMCPLAAGCLPADACWATPGHPTAWPGTCGGAADSPGQLPAAPSLLVRWRSAHLPMTPWRPGSLAGTGVAAGVLARQACCMPQRLAAQRAPAAGAAAHPGGRASQRAQAGPACSPNRGMLAEPARLVPLTRRQGWEGPAPSIRPVAGAAWAGRCGPPGTRAGRPGASAAGAWRGGQLDVLLERRGRGLRTRVSVLDPQRARLLQHLGTAAGTWLRVESLRRRRVACQWFFTAFSVRPWPMALAMAAQRLPSRLCSAMICSSSQAVQASRLMLGASCMSLRPGPGLAPLALCCGRPARLAMHKGTPPALAALLAVPVVQLARDGRPVLLAVHADQPAWNQEMGRAGACPVCRPVRTPGAVPAEQLVLFTAPAALHAGLRRRASTWLGARTRRRL